MIPADYCHCQGEGCKRKNECDRHLSLTRTDIEEIWQSSHMCHWVNDSEYRNYFIPGRKEK